jgi:hypothetical protein
MKTQIKLFLVLAILLGFTNFQSKAQCPPGTAFLHIEILTDDFPEETSFEIKDACSGDVLFASGPLFDPAFLYVFDFCADMAGNYEFVISDAFGDGLGCCANIGSYSVTYDGGLAGSGSASVLFGSGLPCPPPPPAPVNDLCADAISISCGDLVSGTNVGATEEMPGSKGVWYKLNGAEGVTTLTTCSFADFDTRIYVYTGGCDGLTLVAFNDDDFTCPAGGLLSTVTFCSSEVEYLIKVDGFSGQTGNFELSASCTPINIPNDDICSAQLISIGVLTSFDNTCATVEAGEPAPGPGSGPSSCDSQDGWCSFETGLQNTVWFTFTVPSTGAVSIETDGFDTQLALYSADNCGGPFTLLAANDDGGTGTLFSSRISTVYCLQPNKTYYVQVDGFAGQQGAGTIIVNEEPNAKVLVCHKRPKKKDITIEISYCALPAHLAHGDSQGPCLQQRTGQFDNEIADDAIYVHDAFLSAYPNPFSDRTTFEFALPEGASNATLKIFSVTGQEIATLFSGAVEAELVNKVEFSAENLSGNMFIYVLQTENDKFIGRLSVTR